MLSSLYKASVGQLATQGGRPHRRQTCGSSRPSGSTFVMRKRAEETPKRPSCLATQATMQARQPLHKSVCTVILFTCSRLSLRWYFQIRLMHQSTWSESTLGSWPLQKACDSRASADSETYMCESGKPSPIWKRRALAGSICPASVLA